MGGREEKKLNVRGEIGNPLPAFGVQIQNCHATQERKQRNQPMCTNYSVQTNNRVEIKEELKDSNYWI
jgi:hypothetical protein